MKGVGIILMSIPFGLVALGALLAVNYCLFEWAGANEVWASNFAGLSVIFEIGLVLYLMF